MKLYYTEGPEVVVMGVAGTFVCGEPKEVDDSLTDHLLAKTSITFFVEEE